MEGWFSTSVKKIRVKHFVFTFSVLIVLYAVLGGVLGRVLARDSAYRHLLVFQDVMTLVMNNYLKEPEMEKVMGGAIRGMMEALDADSCYLSPEEFQTFKSRNNQPSSNIGVEITKRYYIQLVAVMPGSAAEESGLKPGDLLKSIDGKNTREVNVIVGESMLRGPEGSTLELEIMRVRQPEPIMVTLVRRENTLSPVTFEKLEDETGYIHISQFSKDTATDVKRAVEMLMMQGAQGIVLDVRNSFGRLAEEGTSVAQLFISGGVAARLETRNGETTDLTMSKDQVVFDGEMVVLINHGSSAAAEIVASAFRSSNRGELVGVQTSGRSAVQKVIELDSGAGLVISVAKYSTADGKPLLGVGLEPTIEAFRTAETPEEEDPLLEKATEILQQKLVAKKAA